MKGQDRLLAAGVLAVTAVFVGLMLAPSSAIYSGILGENVRAWLASLAKLALLFLSFATAMRISRRFDPGSTVRRAWSLLAAGFLFFGLGQLILAPYQLIGGYSPFPSPADPFFLLGYPFLAWALFAFVRAYTEAGFPVGSSSARRWVAVGVAVLCSVLALVFLRPVAQSSQSTPLAFALNLTYPILDFVLLFPTVLLIRITWSFRGGEVAEVWVNLLIGFLFMSAGDILFGYFQAKGYTHVDPLIHVTYTVSYWLMARGTLRQVALTAAD